jgi:hypothetical protein
VVAAESKFRVISAANRLSKYSRLISKSCPSEQIHKTDQNKQS